MQDGADVGPLLRVVFVAVVHQRRRQHRRTVLPADDRHSNLPTGRASTVSLMINFHFRQYHHHCDKTCIVRRLTTALNSDTIEEHSSR